MTLTKRGRAIVGLTIAFVVAASLWALIALAAWFGYTHPHANAWALPVLIVAGCTAWFHHLATHTPRPTRPYSAHDEQAAVAGKRRTR